MINETRRIVAILMTNIFPVNFFVHGHEIRHPNKMSVYQVSGKIIDGSIMTRDHRCLALCWFSCTRRAKKKGVR